MEISDQAVKHKVDQIWIQQLGAEICVISRTITSP